MCCDVVSALTQPAIRRLDLATEATNTVRDIRRGAHRLECLFILYLLHIPTYQHQNLTLNEELDQSQPSMNGPAHSFPSNSPHIGPWVEQGTANNNSNSIPFSLSVKTNGDSDLVENFTQYA